MAPSILPAAPSVRRHLLKDHIRLDLEPGPAAAMAGVGTDYCGLDSFFTRPRLYQPPLFYPPGPLCNVLVENITLQKPAMWLQHYLNCDDVIIRDEQIFIHGSPNNDLIDIDESRNVVIFGLFDDSDDHGITLKSTGFISRFLLRIGLL